MYLMDLSFLMNLMDVKVTVIDSCVSVCARVHVLYVCVSLYAYMYSKCMFVCVHISMSCMRIYACKHVYVYVFTCLYRGKVLQESLIKLVEACGDQSHNMDRWLSKLENSKWLTHIHSALSTAGLVAECVER